MCGNRFRDEIFTPLLQPLCMLMMLLYVKEMSINALLIYRDFFYVS